MFYRGKFSMDYVIRYENYENDVKYVMDKLGIKNYKLGCVRTKTKRPFKDDYRKYYNNKTKKLVAKAYKDDIKLFGYTFD